MHATLILVHVVEWTRSCICRNFDVESDHPVFNNQLPNIIIQYSIILLTPAPCYSDLGVTSAGPPSASLLQDWLGIDVGQLNPEDMDAMEKELEAGAPDMFFSDL